ncbi:MAG: AAA family ATPase [Chloroflexota bacterium]
MDLFEQAHQERLQQSGPLAARMRPRTLDEFVGQAHIVGQGRLLRRAIQADQLGSLIFYGPPGTGKTTLAQVIANTTQATFTALNAVLSGVKDIRTAVTEARERAKLHGQRTILFVDEVHRFNKAQQDALLPWVENGTVIFIGATTENPYFEVNKALVSRSRIFQLQPLDDDALRGVAKMALTDRQRGYGRQLVVMDVAALEHLVKIASGDARGLLNALELAVETTEATPIQSSTHNVPSITIETIQNWQKYADQYIINQINLNDSWHHDGYHYTHITLPIVEESIQRRAVLYDKEGDYHFDTISAFIKSLRGSDPDAALYWMAKMLYAGESPRFIFRRMLIFASEDVGMADPNALQVVVACAESFERVGLPEGRFPLSQAALYLATAPKSNTTLALFDALTTVEQEKDSGVPNPLRDGNRDKEGFGHGEGYLYPHAYRDHWVEQQYLPVSLQGKVFYKPSNQGYESGIRHTVTRRREAQLAAMLAAMDDDDQQFTESLTFSPERYPGASAKEQWLQRTVSQTGVQLGEMRDRLFAKAKVARHHLVLDLKAGTGLLTWEALRHAPEGGVYALTHRQQDAEALRQQASQLPEIERPLVYEGTLLDLIQVNGEQAKFVSDLPTQFDRILGYNVLFDLINKPQAVAHLCQLLTGNGRVVLSERVPNQTQRLYALLNTESRDEINTGPIGFELWKAAEESIYQQPDDSLVNWQPDDLIQLFELAGFSVGSDVRTKTNDMQLTEGVIERWFIQTPNHGRSSYVDHLQAYWRQQNLDEDTIRQTIQHLAQLFRRQLLNRTVSWSSTTIELSATPV